MTPPEDRRGRWEPLICPRCRRMGGAEDGPELAGRLLCRRLEPEPGAASGAGAGSSPDASGWLRCGCGARYPVVDGIPAVLRDLDAFLASEGPILLARQDLDPGLAEELALRSGGALARGVRLARVYAGSPPSPLTGWLAEQVAEAEAGPGAVVEIGCGRGIGARSLGLDWNFSLLRAHRGPRVCGDAHDPPLAGGSFAAAVLANVLDSCRDPYLVLAQAAGLLAPGGRLILSCAFAFDDAITMPGGRFSEAELLAGVDGDGFGPYRSGLRLVERQELDWELQISARTTHRHRALALVAERTG